MTDLVKCSRRLLGLRTGPIRDAGRRLRTVWVGTPICRLSSLSLDHSIEITEGKYRGLTGSAR